MDHDEHRQIIEFIEEAVHPADKATLTPVDVEADAIIRALFVRNPEAAYRVTMMAMQLLRETSGLRAQLREALKTASTPKGVWSRLLAHLHVFRADGGHLSVSG